MSTVVGSTPGGRRAASARVSLRQLCHLGLPALPLLPALLPVLRQLVPARHAGFFFCDAQGSITNLYAERMLPPKDMADYHDRHSSPQFRKQYLARVAAPNPLSRRSVDSAERLSAYHRDVLAPLEIEHFLYAIVRHQGVPLGQLSLYRGLHDAPFSAADEQALGSVLHYLGQALAVPSEPALREVQEHTVEEGLALLDPQGRELYADANWARLVRLAHGTAIAPAHALAERDGLPRFVAGVMAAVRSGAAQSVHTVISPWGQFAFRQHTMASPQGDEAVALLVSRMAVQPLRLAQGAAALGLSPQQREVAVLMAQGHSNLAIAQHLGIGINTARYHAKQVFTRLEVHDRSAIGKVLGAAATRRQGVHSYPAAGGA